MKIVEQHMNLILNIPRKVWSILKPLNIYDTLHYAYNLYELNQWLIQFIPTKILAL